MFEHNVISKLFKEDLASITSAQNIIIEALQQGYGTSTEVHICNSGMNAIYATLSQVYELTKGVQSNKKILQLGWLYIDSLELLHNYDFPTINLLNVNNIDIIAEYLEQHHEEIAFVFTELISNPTLQCLDFKALHLLLQQYNIPLIIDSSIASAYTTNALQYCDIIIESLTKFANGHADVLQGAIIVNRNSKTLSVSKLLFKRIETAYIEDIQRMAICIENYSDRVQKISNNTKQLYAYLKNSKQLKSIYCSEDNSNFQKICLNNNTVGIISIVTKEDLAHTYDQLDLAKGPSLGTEFTLCMPYVYLAHYHEIQDPEKYAIIEAQGLDKNLLRISVGIEPIEALIEKFKIFIS